MWSLLRVRAGCLWSGGGAHVRARRAISEPQCCAVVRSASSMATRSSSSSSEGGVSPSAPRLDLSHFLREAQQEKGVADVEPDPLPPYLASGSSERATVHVETYGCQMNVSDTEIVQSILQGAGHSLVPSADEADVVLLNTCAIRENAEGKVWARLRELRGRLQRKRARGVPSNQVVGVLGCMAERLKKRLLEEEGLCQVVVGPDAYRELPQLLYSVSNNDAQSAINVALSLDETYADIAPVRTSANQVSAYVSIMRGCNNMCSYCIVPFTRGRERSRDVSSILSEVQQLSDQGYKEVTLLGQNVNSYNDTTTEPTMRCTSLAPGFGSIVKRPEGGVRFAELLHRVAAIDREMRIRFTSPHPKDFPDEVLEVIRDNVNVCKSLHMPAQSGSSAVLEAMRRNHTREAYLSLIERAKRMIPGVSISSDFISGFCGETEEDHQQTLSLLRTVQYEQAFMFAYSLREKTHAHRKLSDDVPEAVKQRRLREVIETFHEHLRPKNEAEIGTTHLVLVDGKSKRSEEHLAGRSDTNKKIVFKSSPLLDRVSGETRLPAPGDYVKVRVSGSTGITLQADAEEITTVALFSDGSMQ